MFIETFSIVLGAGESRPIAIGGTRFYVLDAAYALAEVAFTAPGGQSAGYLRNVDSGAYAKVNYTGVQITNGSVAQTIRVLLADGDAGSDKLPGTVRILDDSAAKTIAGLQGFTYNRRLANATKVGIVTLTSGAYQVAIKKLSFYQAAAGLIALYRASAAPTDSLNTGNVPNKFMGAPDLACVRQSGLAAGTVPTVGELPGNVIVGSMQVPANTIIDYPLTTPIIVPRNTVFAAVGSAINTEFGIFVDVEEFA